MIVKTESYKELYIYDLGIKFKGGIAEVTDRKKLAALNKMSEQGKYVFSFEDKQEEQKGK